MGLFFEKEFKMAKGFRIGKLPIKIDWTRHPKTGCFNASPAYKRTVRVVKKLLKKDFELMKSGNFEEPARYIVAQLAHIHGLSPQKVKIRTAAFGAGNTLNGRFQWGGQLYSFVATKIY